jgi:hypothetical protein
MPITSRQRKVGATGLDATKQKASALGRNQINASTDVATHHFGWNLLGRAAGEEPESTTAPLN